MIDIASSPAMRLLAHRYIFEFKQRIISCCYRCSWSCLRCNTKLCVMSKCIIFTVLGIFRDHHHFFRASLFSHLTAGCIVYNDIWSRDCISTNLSNSASSVWLLSAHWIDAKVQFVHFLRSFSLSPFFFLSLHSSQRDFICWALQQNWL